MNTTSRESSSKTDKRIDKLADQILTLVEIVSKKVVTPTPVKAVEEICVTCNGPHAWYNCPNTDNNPSSVCAAMVTYNQVNPPNCVSNHMAPPGFAPVVERETEETTDKEQTNFQGSTAHIPPPVNPILILELDVPKTLHKPNIPYPSRRNDQKKLTHAEICDPREPPELELKDLPSHLEYAYLEENDKLPVIIAKGSKDDEKEALLKVLKFQSPGLSSNSAKVDVILDLWTHLLEKETPFVFCKDCIDAFETLKKKLTKLRYLVVPIGNLPLETYV
ncbi:hypothetical protein Tco_0921870 [Tanacetum coccineum]